MKDFYKKLKLFSFTALIISATTLAMLSTARAQEDDGVLVDPPCETTTCISQEAIDIAKNKEAEYDKMNSYYELETHKEGCVQPRPTGAVVYRQIFGELFLFFDSFCTNQGCEPSVADGANCEKVGN